MAGNTFGKVFTLTSFGESHGAGIGGIIDGCPPGIALDMDFIQSELDRRRPGQSKLTTQRKEPDRVEFLSGIFEGQTTGTPIGFVVWNTNQKPKDYRHLKEAYRPSHADYTYDKKYGVRDYRGGGRSSARETVARVVAGALAKLLLKQVGVTVNAWVSAVGNITMQRHWEELDLNERENNLVRCPDPEAAAEMEAAITAIRKQGDTLGGVISAAVTGVPVGWGEPVFDKLHADLGKAMLSINAVKGFEYGSGFLGATLRGTEHNDTFVRKEGDIATLTNHSGGIQGGISNGENITFKVAFKPVATVMQAQETVNSDAQKVTLEGKGRHDPCVVPRAVPIVEAMAAITLADHYLRQKMYH
ncbi:MAG: chorismate synthase [Salibacteraceae bacterium]